MIRPRVLRFTPAQRALHWGMAAAVLAMLFIGVGMVSTVAPRYWVLVSIHKPLGIAILALAVVRLGVRARHGAPPLPQDLPPWQRLGAGASHVLLYGLMLAMPVIGWAMLSAGGYPIVLWGPVHLPPIAPHDARLHALLHAAHVWLAYLLFATILLHLAAALFHAVVRRDGVLEAMAPWPSPRPAAPVRPAPALVLGADAIPNHDER
jgi:cytochrome b561